MAAEINGKFLIIGNSKIEQTFFSEVEDFCKELANPAISFQNVILGYAPPLIFLDRASQILKNSEFVCLGSQAIGEKEKGTYTAMPSALPLREIGVQFSLIDHPEAMAFGWGGNNFADQIMASIKNAIMPVYIIGEPTGPKLLEREERRGFLKQKLSALAPLNENRLIAGNLNIAYESGFTSRLDAKLETDYIGNGFDLTDEILNELNLEKLAKKGGKMFGVGITLDTIKSVLDLIFSKKLRGILIGKSSTNASELLTIAEIIDKEIAELKGHKKYIIPKRMKASGESDLNSFKIPTVPKLPKNKIIEVAIAGFGEVGAGMPAVLSVETSIFLTAGLNKTLSAADAEARAVKNRFLDMGDISAENEKLIFHFLNQEMDVISVDFVAEIEKAVEIMPKVDILVYSAGNVMKKEEFVKPFLKKAKYIILTSNSPVADATIIPGVNHYLFDPDIHRIIALSSCTSQWGIPIIAVVEEIVGRNKIKEVIVGGAHSVTNTQPMGDIGFSAKEERCLNNLCFTDTGIKDAIKLLFPEIKVAAAQVARAPVEHASLGEMIIIAPQSGLDLITFKNEFKRIISAPRWQGVIEWDEKCWGSKNYWKSRAGSVVFGPLIKVSDYSIVIYGVYANIFGYCSQLRRLIQVLGNKI